MGWSLRDLAEVIDTARCDEGEEAPERFLETLKKQLTRSSTSPDKLEDYLQIMKNDRRYEKLAEVRQDYVSLGILNNDVEDRVRRISERVAEKVKSSPDEWDGR